MAARALLVLALAVAQVAYAQDCACSCSAAPGAYSGAGLYPAAPGVYSGAGLYPAAPEYYPAAAADASYLYPGAISAAAGAAGVYGLEEGCCPGKVIEQKSVVNKAVNVPYSYNVPTISKKCYQTTNVAKSVVPLTSATEKCQTQQTIVKVPTTDILTQETPLCKKTCTTSEYIIQIPIVETVCTSSPLCKKTVRAQNNVIITNSKKTSCAKNVCTQNKVVEQPLYETVCQKYQGSVSKVGTKTVIKPEVIKKCVQLPPYKCLKPTLNPSPLYDAAYPTPAPYDVLAAPAYPGPAAYELAAPLAYAPAPLAYGPAPLAYGPAPAPAPVFSAPAEYLPSYAPGPYLPAPGPLCPCA